MVNLEHQDKYDLLDLLKVVLPPRIGNICPPFFLRGLSVFYKQRYIGLFFLLSSLGLHRGFYCGFFHVLCGMEGRV